NNSYFPDPKNMLQQLKKLDFKSIVIIDPGIKIDPNYEIYKEGVEKNHFLKDGEKLFIGKCWPGNSHFPDFLNENTRDWWGNLYKPLLDCGVNGFWNDMNE